MDKKALFQELKVHEGLELHVYLDTKGIPTVGIGHNLENDPAEKELGRTLKVGDKISEDEAMQLFDKDLTIAVKEVSQVLSCFNDLSEVRQCVLVDMAFNLGVPRLKKFSKTLSAIENSEYEIAAKEMLDSSWARQVKSRAPRLALMMEKDLDFEKALKEVPY